MRRRTADRGAVIVTGPHNGIVMETELGTIEIDLDRAVAPRSCRFVLDLVAAGIFDGSSFYRSTSFGVDDREPLIQGGPLAPLFTGADSPVPSVELLDVIESTGATSLRHTQGTVSLARDLFGSGRVLPEIFICLDDYPELDEGGRTEPDALGFPAFGSVSGGLDVVESIASMEARGDSPISRLIGEVLTHPVRIIRVTATPSTTESSTTA